MKTPGLQPPIYRTRQRAIFSPLNRCALVALGLLSLSSISEGQGQAGAGAAAGTAAPVPDNSAVGIASREATRRIEAVKAAQELLTAAEYDRSENRNKEALEKLETAFLSIMNVPAARETRQAIFGRYQKAVLAYAGELIDQARWDEAKEVLTEAMSTARDAGMLPAQMDPGIRQTMERLKGDYFNQAMTPEHLDAVTLVERNLKEANVLIGAGDFDGARTRYRRVLNLDRYNVAARRGLEKLEQLVMEYQRVAFSQTRAAQMRKVAEQWEIQAPPTMAANLAVAEDLITAGTGQAALQEKLKRIVIPEVQFQDTPLRTVIDYLIQKSEELDPGAGDPNNRGLNIVVDAGNSPLIENQAVTIRLTNAPLEDVLNYVTRQIGMKYRVDEFAVTITPLNAVDGNRLITRHYDVPPGFLSADGGGGGGAGAPDPFAPQPAGGGAGTLVRRVTAREFLEKRGVTFPEGSSAQMTGNSTLLVRNTADNIELIESLVMAAREGGNKLVMVEFKMITIGEDTLKELGFDWLVGPFNIDNSGKVFGAGGTTGNQDPRQPNDYPFPEVGGQPVTGGLRSGTPSAARSIQDVINRDSPTSTISTAAPGVLGLAGVFTDPQFQVVWRSLNQRKGIDRLCMASVVTRPGERAIVRQVREFIYPTEYDPPEIPTNFGGGPFPATPATPAAFETRDLGKVMEVEPVIGADNLTVDLNIATDVTDFVGFINYGSPITNLSFLNLGERDLITGNRILMPVFDAVKNTTNVAIYDGQTVAIGGLIGEQIDTTNDKVPVLGDTPLVGALFRSQIQEHKRRALILFATVRILDGTGRPLNDMSQYAPVATAEAR